MHMSSMIASRVSSTAVPRPALCGQPVKMPRCKTSTTTRTKSWNSNHHILIPAMQWAAAYSVPAQAASNSSITADASNSNVSPTASAPGSISSALPDGRAVLNYRDASESGSITSRSNAGVISVASPPAPAQTDVDADDDAKPMTEEESSKQTKQFNWNKMWYAVAVLEHLDPSKPTPAQLLGMDLVLWRDNTGMWRAFQDCCPHRLAPLSEGRIDDKSGNLYCNYHGWQFNGSGSCTHIPQLPSDPPLNPNPKRSCVQSYPTTTAEGLLWVWGEAGPAAAAEAAAAALPTLAPEIGQFGDEAYWSSKLFFEDGTYLGKWYQRMCNASYETVKENVFNDPSHDTVLHHGLGGLSRDLSGPGKVQDYHLDEKGYTISRLNPTGRIVNDVCIFPSSQRRNFAPKPGMGAGVGYVTPTSPGKCNMMIALLREPAYAQKPKGLKALIAAAMPPTPEWLRHLEMHRVVDADVAMQHGQDVNGVKTELGGYMPAIGMDQGPIAFKKWLMQYAGNGPFTMSESLEGFSSVTALPRDKLLNRYDSHTKHCKYCSAALKNFQALHKITSQLFNILAAAAVGVAAVQMVQASQAVVGAAAAQAGVNRVSAGLLAGGVSNLVQGMVEQLALAPAAVVLGGACVVAWVLASWSEKMIGRFIFVDYDHSHISKK